MNTLLSAGFLKVAGVAVTLFVLLDMLWLGLVANKLYREQLGFLANLKEGAISFNLPVGILVQAVIALGLAAVIVLALNQNYTLAEAVFWGALTGFVIYFTYDFTNYSFVKDWPLMVSLIDVVWGTSQGVMAGVYVYYLFGLWMK